MSKLIGQNELVLEVRELVDVYEALADGQTQCNVVLVVAYDADEVELEFEQLLLVRMDAVQVFVDQAEEELLVQDIHAFLSTNERYNEEMLRNHLKVLNQFTFRNIAKLLLQFLNESLNSGSLANMVIIAGAYFTIDSMIRSKKFCRHV